MRTEDQNPRTIGISEATTEEMLEMINYEDSLVADIVKKCIPDISKLVDAGYNAIKNGGRIVYCGCGTSGRLAVADAAEIPPTYGVSNEFISAVIAGGVNAIVNASEGCEDDEEKGRAAFLNTGCGAGDLIIGISAAGRAPFVLSFMREAKKHGCIIGAITNNEGTPMEQEADIAVVALTGAECIKGSTRMKAGTSQKMVLNMFSTAVFIKYGCVYQNYMINMAVSNSKLKNRAIVTVSDITSLDKDEASALLEKNDWIIRDALREYFKNENI